MQKLRHTPVGAYSCCSSHPFLKREAMPDQIRRRPGEEQATRQQHSFDELAKGMASSTMSRRGALKVLVGALLGGGLLAAFPGVSGAQEQGGGGSVGGGGGGHHHHHRFCPKGEEVCHTIVGRVCCVVGTCTPQGCLT